MLILSTLDYHGQPMLNDTAQSGALLKGLDKIANIVARYQLVTDSKLLDDSAPHRNYRYSIIELYGKILEYQATAVCQLDRNTFERFMRNIPKLDSWDEMLKDISVLDDNCRYQASALDSSEVSSNLSLITRCANEQASRLGNIESLMAKVTSLHESVEKKEREVKGLALLISDIDVFQDHEDVRARLRSKYWNSGRWLLESEEYAEWAELPSSVLLLQGPHGVGKSCLASVVIQHILSSLTDEQVAFFYSSQQLTEPVDILRSILAQLSLSTAPHLATPIQNWFEEHAPEVLRSSKAVTGAEARMFTKIPKRDCVNLLKQFIQSHQQTTIVIDALDECRKPFELLECLGDIHECCDNMRLFITARFGAPETRKLSDAVIITDLKTDSDMKSFIKQEIKSDERRKESGMTPEQAVDLQQLLLHKAQGMFRWVELQLDLILDPENPTLHTKDVQAYLNRLQRSSDHPSLSLVYGELIKHNTRNQPHSQYLAAKALQWMLASLKPLNMDILIQAVALDSAGNRDPMVDERFLLRICSNLIIRATSGVVKFAHRSVKEYLRGRDLPQGFGDKFSTEKCHAQAAETCVTFVLTLGNESEWGHLPVDVRAEAPSVVKLTSFEVYACLFWAKHCEMAGVFRLYRPLEFLINELMLGRDIETASVAFQKWNSVLWRYLSSMSVAECVMMGFLKTQLEDVVSTKPHVLFASCVFGFPEVVSISLKRDSRSVKMKNRRGKSLLLLASENGQKEVVGLLLAEKADIHEAHNIWGNVSQAAAWGGHLELFKYLANRGADLNAEPGQYGRVMDAALRGGNEELVVYALQLGVDVWLPYQTMDGKTSVKGRTLDYEKLKGEDPAYLLPFPEQIGQAERCDLVRRRNLLFKRMELANMRRREVLDSLRLHGAKVRRSQHPLPSLSASTGKAGKHSYKGKHDPLRSQGSIDSEDMKQKQLPDPPDDFEHMVRNRQEHNYDSLEDICPICYEDLFPVYRMGIESRERHIARHMEKEALIILDDQSDHVVIKEGSDSSQSDEQSVAGWSSEGSADIDADFSGGNPKARDKESIGFFTGGLPHRGAKVDMTPFM
ncbi:MAG: hypothetical protein Q9218_004776 [Villophora microphyllina]